MRPNIPFYQVRPSHNNISVTSASANIQLSEAAPQLDTTYRVVNSGTKIAYMAAGTGSDTAATAANGVAILPGAPAEYFNLPEGLDRLAFICGGSDTTTISVTLGRGGL